MFAVTILESAASLIWFYAVSIGFISLINALENTQYFFVLLYATLISAFMPGFSKRRYMAP